MKRISFLISCYLLLTNDDTNSRFNDVAAYTVAQEEHVFVRLGGGCVGVINDDVSDSRNGRVVYESCSIQRWRRSAVIVDDGSQDGRIVRQFQLVRLRQRSRRRRHSERSHHCGELRHAPAPSANQ